MKKLGHRKPPNGEPAQFTPRLAGSSKSSVTEPPDGGGGGGGAGGASGAGGAGDAGDDRTYDDDYNSPRPNLAALRRKRDKDREAEGLSIVGRPEEPRDPPRVTYTPIQIQAIRDVQVRIEDACNSPTPLETAARGMASGWCDEFWPKARRILVAYDGSKAAQGADIVELMRELQERLAAHAEN